MKCVGMVLKGSVARAEDVAEMESRCGCSVVIVARRMLVIATRRGWGIRKPRDLTLVESKVWSPFLNFFCAGLCSSLPVTMVRQSYHAVVLTAGKPLRSLISVMLIARRSNGEDDKSTDKHPSNAPHLQKGSAPPNQPLSTGPDEEDPEQSEKLSRTRRRGVMFSRGYRPDRSMSSDECNEKVLSGGNSAEAEFGDSRCEERA